MYKRQEQHQEVHEKTKENWIGEQCNEIEENLRKNNSKRAYQLLKDLTTVKQGKDLTAMKQEKVATVQDRSGNCLTEEPKKPNRWTKYCCEPYNHKAKGDPSVLDCPQADTEDDHTLLRKEVEAAAQSVKKGQSAGIDVPAELVQACGGGVLAALTTICDKIWQNAVWSTPWTQFLVITIPKKGYLQQC